MGVFENLLGVLGRFIGGFGDFSGGYGVLEAVGSGCLGLLEFSGDLLVVC